MPGRDHYLLLKVLLDDQPLRYRLTGQVLLELSEAGVAAKIRATLALLPLDQDFYQAELDQHLPQLRVSRVKLLTELIALASYQAQPDYPRAKLLLTDDAPDSRL